MIDIVGIENNVSKLKEKPTIAKLFNELADCGPSLILGGAVRDWILGYPPRDIDIVVSCPTKKLKFLKQYDFEKNRFGGYYLKVDGTEFDIWSVESTWAIKYDEQFDKTLETIPNTVFLSMDAIGYRLDTKEIYDSGFEKTTLNRELDIIYARNPYPFLCASRALVGLVKYDLLPSQNLIDFLRYQKLRGYNKESFVKFLDLRKINYSFEAAMEKVNHGS